MEHRTCHVIFRKLDFELLSSSVADDHPSTTTFSTPAAFAKSSSVTRK
jgi:hypothetical protein